MTTAFHEVQGLEEPCLPALLDIYQQSFPLREQMPFSWWIGFLRKKAAGQAENAHLLALLENENVLAMAYYEVKPEPEPFGTLWYLATQHALRGKGIGAQLYQEIVARLIRAGCRGLLFEVEKPEEAALVSAEEADFARRRIAWYQRQGAQRLHGIRYRQDVGWQPPTEMDLMIHPFDALSAEQAFVVAKHLLGDAVEQRGPLHLEAISSAC